MVKPTKKMRENLLPLIVRYLLIVSLETFPYGDAHAGIGTVVDKITSCTEIELPHPVVPLQVLPSQGDTQAGTRCFFISGDIGAVLEK